jgi:hypothetical protein
VQCRNCPTPMDASYVLEPGTVSRACMCYHVTHFLCHIHWPDDVHGSDNLEHPQGTEDRCCCHRCCYVVVRSQIPPHCAVMGQKALNLHSAGPVCGDSRQGMQHGETAESAPTNGCLVLCIPSRGAPGRWSCTGQVLAMTCDSGARIEESCQRNRAPCVQVAHR